jgi:hypothetical protein
LHNVNQVTHKATFILLEIELEISIGLSTVDLTVYRKSANSTNLLQVK